MSRLRWVKLRRDIRLSRGRMAVMVIAIAISVAAVAAFLQARAILGREITANYLAGRPASATLHLSTPVTPDDVALARSLPGVIDAVARDSMQARVRMPGGSWQPLLLFISAPGDPHRLSSAAVERGSWPPAADGLFLERTALPFLGAQVGDRVEVRAPGGLVTTLTVTGSVHDPGVAPAHQERTAYGQVTTAGLIRLGLPATLSELKIAVGAPGRAGSPDQLSGNQAAITRTAEQVAAALPAGGLSRVTRVDVPPPLRHPHDRPMVTVTFLLLACGLTALLLSSILVATMLGGMLTAQIRQLGAMKAVGARTGQLFGMYLVLAGAVAVLATGLGVPLGLAAGRLLARAAAGLLNLDLNDTTAPWWVLMNALLAGVGVPVLVAVPPLMRGARRTVREAIDDHGADPRRAAGPARVPALPGTSRIDALALRNLGRRPGRLALTVGLLAVAGATFVTGLNSARGWDALAREGVTHRHYDVEIRFDRPVPAERVLAVAAGVPGVRQAEAWNATPTAAARLGRVDVAHVYPDDAHGSFTLMAPPAQTPLISLPVLSGRWLQPDDRDTVVLNSLAAGAQLRGAQVRDRVLLTVAGRQVPFTVAGIVSDFGSQAVAYVTDRQYAALTAAPRGGATPTARLVRVVTDATDPAGRRAVLERLSQALDSPAVPVQLTLTTDDLRSAFDGHVFVLIEVLIVIALLVGVVGLLGLGAAMSTSVTERTREFAVMQAIGARPGMVRRLVITEGVLTGIAGLLVAVAASLPMTWWFGSFLGQMAFRQPLPTAIGPAPLLLWTTLTLTGAAIATGAAARRASRLTIREALTVV